MKRFFRNLAVLTMIFSGLLISSCDVLGFTQVPLVPLGTEGRVLSEVVYYGSYEETVFSPDGTYVEKYYDYEDEAADLDGDLETGEGRVLVETYSGTYAFNRENRTLRLSLDEYSAAPFETSMEMEVTATFNALPGKDGLYQVYLKNEDGEWVYSEDILDGEFRDVFVQTYTIENGESITRLDYYEDNYSGPDGELEPYGEQETVYGITRQFPGGFRRGTTTTFYTEVTGDRVRMYDYTSDSWGSWADILTPGLKSFIFTHGGEYMFAADTHLMATRGLASDRTLR